MKRGRGWEREGRDGIKGVGLRLKIKWVEVFGIWRYSEGFGRGVEEGRIGRGRGLREKIRESGLEKESDGRKERQRGGGRSRERG